MDQYFTCPDCGIEHEEPADAVLGHLARCLTCLVDAEHRDDRARKIVNPPLAA